MNLPPRVRADIIGSVAARHLKHRDFDDLCAQIAYGLGWTVAGGYPRTDRVRNLLRGTPGDDGAQRQGVYTMRRHVAQRILDYVGADVQEYHDMLHKMTCGELGAEDMAYINHSKE